MPTVLTAKAISALKPAQTGRRYDLTDAIVPGFGVRVTETGRKSYILTARFPGSKNPTRRTIATVGAIELAEAREIAREWIAQILKGANPGMAEIALTNAGVEKPEQFSAVASQFLIKHVLKNGLRSAGEIERLIKREMLPVWGGREFVSIRRADVAALLDAIEDRAPVLADQVLAVISKLCNWYMARNEDYVSPIVRGMRRTKPRERARRRILNDKEIGLLWRACDQCGTFGGLLRLALLTGQRRAKVRLMKWEDVDRNGVWTIQTELREKTNAKELRLSRMAFEVIKQQEFVRESHFVFGGKGGVAFNGFSKAKSKIDEKISILNGSSIPNWTVHDLRRTAKSLMARAGVRPDVSERVLGHVIPGVEGTYDRYEYEVEKAAALEHLSEILASILEEPAKSDVPYYGPTVA